MSSFLIEYAHDSSSEPEALVATWDNPLEVLHSVSREDRDAVRPIFIGPLSEQPDKWYKRVFAKEHRSTQPTPTMTLSTPALHEVRGIFYAEGRELALPRFRETVRHSLELALQPVQLGCPRRMALLDDAVMTLQREDALQMSTDEVSDFFYHHLVRGIRDELKARGLGELMETGE